MRHCRARGRSPPRCALPGKDSRVVLPDGKFAANLPAFPAIQASLNWKPTDYLLFGLNYAHIKYDDAAIDADPTAGVDRNYSVDMVGARAQIDF